jgi:hypothetical protein
LRGEEGKLVEERNLVPGSAGRAAELPQGELRSHLAGQGGIENRGHTIRSHAGKADARLARELHVHHGLFRAHAEATDLDDIRVDLLFGKVGLGRLHGLGRARAETARAGSDEDCGLGDLLTTEKRDASGDVAASLGRQWARRQFRQ